MRVGVVAVVVLGMAAASLATGDHDVGHGAHRSAGEGWKTVWSGTLSSNQGEWVGLYLPRSDADAPNHYRLSWGGDFEAPNTGDTARGGADQILWWLVNGGNAGDYPFAWRSRQGGPPAVPPDLGQSCPRMVTAPAL